MNAYITVGENYDLAWMIRPKVAMGTAEWYHFKEWDPQEIRFTEEDLVAQGYEVYEVYRSNVDHKYVQRNVVSGREREV